MSRIDNKLHFYHAYCMDQKEPPFLKTLLHKPKQVLLVIFFISFIIAVPLGIAGYHLGYVNGSRQPRMLQDNLSIKLQKKAVSTIKSSPSLKPSSPYVLSYSIPSGWHTIIWHPTPDSSQSAILSPNYTSQNDPTPQTGMSILIYRFPESISSMQQLRTSILQEGNGVQHLTQTTIGELPAIHAWFIDSDDNLIFDEYHILKNNDHWIIRFVFPSGSSLSEAQNEEDLYKTQINELLQSIQFQ